MSDSLAFDPESVDLDAMLKRLHLANARRVWRTLCETAEQEAWSPRKFLALLTAEEISHRHKTRLQREVRKASFPFLKTIEDFNFSLQSSLRLSLLGSYLGPELISEGRSLVLFGKTGRGKTHLAVAIAYRAIQNGFTARFITCAQLVDDLGAATQAGDFRRGLAAFVQPNLDFQCAVKGVLFPAGANPARQLSLQPEALEAVQGGNELD
jgi:DNA replication protein DnaC